MYSVDLCRIDQFLLEAMIRNRTRSRMDREQEQEQRQRQKEQKEQKEQEREWYVRLENLYLNDSFMGYKRIITRSDLRSDLVDSIIQYYHIPFQMRYHMKLYSNPFRSRRLDTMENIPTEFEFVHIYFF